MTIAQLYQLFLAFPTVCTDTRKISRDCLFFALKGDHFNGNQFAGEALAGGAAYAIVDEREYADAPRTVLVENCLQTLQQLANHHRKQCSAQIVGLTGSNGKTTTKELIRAVLTKKYRTVATQGNLNNHIGVPLTLLSIQRDTQIAIVEMGANHPGEIAFLSTLAEPDFGYITNFGKAHLEGFGSAEGVINAKSELYTFLRARDRPIFFNADDPVQVERLKSYTPTFGFSVHDPQYYVIKDLGARPFVALEVEGTPIFSQLIGTYNFTNCCAAILIGHYFGVPLRDIKEAIEEYTPHNNRSQLILKNGNDIILDAYNANPTSLRAALENFDLMEGKEKIVFIGDMFELGKAAAEEHQDIADLASSMAFEKVYLIGENFYRTKGSLQQYSSFEALAKALQNTPLKNKQILIKGSRGMALERILDLL